MALINTKVNEIQLKIVYYGPGRAGKTSSLEYIQNKLASRTQSKMIKLKEYNERTLFFDYYTLNIGKIKGFNIRIQLYSVPGQYRLEPLRRLIIRGVDGILFVADAMSLRRQHNIESFQNLIDTLNRYNKKLSAIPLAIQFNKVDLAKDEIPIISLYALKADLRNCLGENWRIIDKTPFFESSNVSGKNVLKALQEIIRMTVSHLNFDAIGKAN